MGGFCRRCGEIMRGQGGDERCRCGGSSKDSSTKALFAPTPTDKWTQSYTSRSAPPSPEHLATTVPRYNLPGHKSHAPEESQELKAAFGSVLSPKDSWGCVSCSKKFVREEIIYPHPDAKSDPSLSEAFFCRQCFAEEFAQGTCRGCRCAVLSDAPFVRNGDDLWHSACYRCKYCSAEDEVVIDITGNPSCVPCFDSYAFKSANVPPSPHLSAQSRFSSTALVNLPPAPTKWGRPSLGGAPSPTSVRPRAKTSEPASRLRREREQSPMVASYDELGEKLRRAGIETTPLKQDVQARSSERNESAAPLLRSPNRLDFSRPKKSPGRRERSWTSPTTVTEEVAQQSQLAARRAMFESRDATATPTKARPLSFSTAPARLPKKTLEPPVQSPKPRPVSTSSFLSATSPAKAPVPASPAPTFAKAPSTPSSFLALASRTAAPLTPATNQIPRSPALISLATPASSPKTATPRPSALNLRAPSPIKINGPSSPIRDRWPPAPKEKASPAPVVATPSSSKRNSFVPPPITLPGRETWAASSFTPKPASPSCGAISPSEPAPRTSPTRPSFAPALSISPTRSGYIPSSPIRASSSIPAASPPPSRSNASIFAPASHIESTYTPATVSPTRSAFSTSPVASPTRSTFPRNTPSSPTTTSAPLPTPTARPVFGTLQTTENPLSIDQDTCGGCGQELGYGEFIEIPKTGEIRHRGCFLCAGCGEQLEGGRHVEADEAVWHSQCAPAPKRYRSVLTSLADSPAEEDEDRAALPYEVRTDSCAGCGKPFGTAPALTLPRAGKSYHAMCLSCSNCHEPFGRDGGDRSFVENNGRPFHPSCAPRSRSPPKLNRSRSPLRTSTSRSTFVPPIRRSPSPPVRAPAAPSTAPSLFATRHRPPAGLGGLLVCAGCSVRVTERESVPGPLSKRYHSRCLVCGLCARALDSEARVVGEGMLRCEACRKTEARRSAQKMPVSTGV